ncbi:MAG: PEP-CTERM sorting domain-containing protein [Gammaproteobacteria bacterium]
MLRTGQLYSFTLRGAGRAVASPIGMGNSAAADFQVVVDPVFSFVNADDATLYSFAFSPNLAPVPAPASIWLLGSALPVVGWYRRRRRRAPI